MRWPGLNSVHQNVSRKRKAKCFSFLCPLALRSLASHSLCPPEDGQAAISAELRRAKRLLLLDDFRPNLATPMTMTERGNRKRIQTERKSSTKAIYRGRVSQDTLLRHVQSLAGKNDRLIPLQRYCRVKYVTPSDRDRGSSVRTTTDLPGSRRVHSSSSSSSNLDAAG